MNNNNSSIVKRDTTLDIVRALCILEVVAFWHMQDYIDVSECSKDFFTFGGNLTMGVLSTFVFLSGFFLSKYKFATYQDVTKFYEKRFKRFWGLFFVASLCLYIPSFIAGDCWYTSPLNFVYSLFGLTVFWGPHPATLWFMCMTMFFYLITPLLMFNKIYCRITSSIICVVVIAMLTVFLKIDNRTVFYLPIYICGLYLPKIYIEKLYDWKGYILFIVLNILLCAALTVAEPSVMWLKYLIAIDIAVSLTVISHLINISNLKFFKWLMEKISYASLCMYLFHRHFYLFLVFAYCGSLSNIRSVTLPLIVVLLIGVPMIIIGSFLIQKSYDIITNKLWNNKS